MRIDLCLQRLQLSLAERKLLRLDLRHQPLHHADHVPEGIRQRLQLGDGLVRPGIGIGLRRTLKVLHRAHKTVDRAVDDAGIEQHRRRSDQHAAEQHGSHKADDCLPPRGGKLIGVTDADDAPAVRQGRNRADRVVKNMRAVFKRRHLVHVLLADPGVQHLLLRVVDHFAVPVDHIAIAVPPETDIVNVLRDAREAEIHGDRHIAAENCGIHAARQCYDPRIIIFIQVADVRQRDHEIRRAVKGACVKGKAARCLRFQLSAARRTYRKAAVPPPEHDRLHIGIQTNRDVQLARVGQALVRDLGSDTVQLFFHIVQIIFKRGCGLPRCLLGTGRGVRRHRLSVDGDKAERADDHKDGGSHAEQRHRQRRKPDAPRFPHFFSFHPYSCCFLSFYSAKCRSAS